MIFDILFHVPFFLEIQIGDTFLPEQNKYYIINTLLTEKNQVYQAVADIHNIVAWRHTIRILMNTLCLSQEIVCLLFSFRAFFGSETGQFFCLFKLNIEHIRMALIVSYWNLLVAF